MKIADRSYVEIHYSLALDGGETVDESRPGAPLDFVFGVGQVVPGLEKALAGLEEGAETSFVVEPEEGYGEASPALVKEIPRDRFPAELMLQEGMVLEASAEGTATVFRIAEVRDDAVVADFNHPLSGRRLHFEVRVETVRAATDDEIAAATCAHGASGCACCGHDDCDAN